MRSIKLSTFSLLLSVAFLFAAQATSHAAFPTKGSFQTIVSVVDTPQKAHVHPEAERDPFATPAKKKQLHKHGFLAYFAMACGVVGLLFAGVPSVLFMYLFGLTAGICGANGVKRFKHDKLLRALSYVGIILGGLAVILATIPILLLL